MKPRKAKTPKQPAWVHHIDGVEVPAGTVAPKPRESLLWPNPDIPGSTLFMEKDLWRHPITLGLTDDPRDLALSPAELLAKYGPAFVSDKELAE